jgi:HEPN domain-containing protein
MELQIVLNSFATDVFRKQADFDYVAARMNYRMCLRQQFLWSGQQAIEKYLKAILLYNGKSARFYNQNGRRKFGHDLVALNVEVNRLEYLRYELPDWAPQFIEYLKELGGFNRYLSKSSYNNRDALHRLDELVWNIRRYCQYIPGRGIECTEQLPIMREAVINSINNPAKRDNPVEFKLFRGELERIINLHHKEPARKALVWANFFYGKRNRNVVSFRPMLSFEIPPQERSWFDNEADRDIISEYIQL